MAENNQFMAIIGKHPEILKAMKEAEERAAQKKTEGADSTPAEPPRAFNPFNKKRAQQAAAKPKEAAPAPKEEDKKPEEDKTKTTVQQPTVVEEEDNDPALEAVAQQPDGTTINPDVTVKSMKKTVVAQQKDKGNANENVTKSETKPETQVAEDKAPQQTEKDSDKQEANISSVEPEEEEEILTPAYFVAHLKDFKKRYFFHDLDLFKHNVCERVRAITIPSDINAGMAKVRLAEINQLRNELLENRMEIKMLYECPFETNKGDIAVAARAQAQGNSDGERQRLFCSYLKNFPIKEGETVNIAYIRTILGMYNNIFETAIAELTEKRQALILVFSSLKLDASMA